MGQFRQIAENLLAKFDALGNLVGFALPGGKKSLIPALNIDSLSGGLSFVANDTNYAVTVTPATNDSAGISAAANFLYIVSRNAGVIKLVDAAYAITEPLPKRDGLSYIGEQPRLTFTTDIMDQDWTITGGTRLVAADNSITAFAHNNVARGSPITNFCSDILSGVTLKNLAFIGFKRGVDIGATNASGAARCNFDELYFYDCLEWAMNVENFAHCDFGTFFGRTTIATGGGYRYVASVATSIWEPGNSRFSRRMFFQSVSIKVRGIVFEANNSGTLNEITVESAQSNRFGGNEVTATWTTAITSSDITVADATAYPVGFMIVPTATAAGFTSGQAYFVVYSSGTTIRLGNRPYGTAITATANGNLPIKTKGFALMEVISSDSGTGSSITNSRFTGLDLEGTSSAALVQSYGINNVVNLQQAFTAQYANLVFRNVQKGRVDSAYAAVTDFDAVSNDTCYTGLRAAIPAYSWAGWGLWRDVSATSDKGVISLNARSAGPSSDLKGVQVSGVGSAILAALAIIQPQSRFGSGNQTLTYTQNGGTCIFNGSSASVWTLPAVNAGFLGAPFKLVNAGTNTLTINSAGELFNQVAAKTSYSLAPGQWLQIESAQTSTSTLFWAVLATNGT